MKTLAICQARMGSTRLPGKVMRDLHGMPLLRWTVNACHASHLIDDVVVATSTLVADDKIAQYCKEQGIPCFRGSESDVLDRFYHCAKKHKGDIILRFTCDCPFLDPAIIDLVIKLREMKHADYASNCYPATYPDGLDTECFTFAALEIAHQEATNSLDRDCLTQYIIRNRNRFTVVNLTNPLPGGENEHWVCDSADDFKFCEEIARRLDRYPTSPLPIPPSYIEILSLLDENPKLREINSKSIRNERFYEALAQERLSPRTFERSLGIHKRACARIPTGANTFSKSHLQFPGEGSPLYASHGDGAYIFDVDGNRYVDLVGALLPVVLGYCDPDVDRAVREQLDNGVLLSLGTRLEVELAETLCRLIPCAEMVKFGKTGTDVTTAAIRLARAHTGRDHILSSGYHGWADWSMATTNRHAGIPENVAYFSHRIEYGKQEAGESYESVAAIIVEPNDDPEYLKWLRDYCTKHGIVLIFDEIRTGFRHDIGGAQALYQVIPDLACFGKAMANGMPISALVGKREIMQRMETPDVYYSGTFFSETLSIAAALATIKKMEKEDVVGVLTRIGMELEFRILSIINANELQECIDLDGWYTNQSLTFKGPYKDQIRTLFMQKMFQNGVLIINSNNLSYAMKKPEVERIIYAYKATMNAIALATNDGSIKAVKPTEAAPLRVA